jgi:hypothetical protein
VVTDPTTYAVQCAEDPENVSVTIAVPSEAR